jgi:ABC-2 type transport system permease protein
MAVLEIARVNLLRVFRDRGNLFFVFLMPLLIIIALAAVFGGSGTSRLGVVRADAGPLGDALVATLAAGELDVEVRERGSLDELRDGVERGELHLGLLIPPGYDAALRSGESVEVSVLMRDESRLGALAQVVDEAVANRSAQLRAARFAVEKAGLPFEAALAAAEERQTDLPGIVVRSATLGTTSFPSGGNPFALGAQSQTVLFMFLTSLTAATQLLLTRQLGVSRRMLATPTPVRSILLGELAGRFAVALMQGLFIVLVSAFVFGVGWGDLAGASVVIGLFALVGTGAAMIVGVFAGSVDQAGALGVLLGLALGALGGAMVPPEVFQEPMSTISRLTPHAWAIEALRDLAYDGAGLLDLLAPLAMLTAYAAVLVGIGIWGLRRSLTRSS